MKRHDGRSLPHATLETLRLMAVRRVRAGEKPSAVIASYGFCRTTIYRWLRAAAEGGERAVHARKGTGRPPVLTPQQTDRVRRWINGKEPRQYGFDFGLWTRQVVRALIAQRFRQQVGRTTVGRLLAQLGITPQKPLRRAYERDPVAIARWTRETVPARRRRAKRRGAVICFLDEAGVRSDAPLGRTWAPRGRTPVVRTSGRRQAVTAISAVTARGAFWYRTYTGRLNALTFEGFLRAFLKRRRHPVLRVLDRHPAHIATRIAHFVQAQRGRLELHVLPGYAPDLNPDEFVWNYLRQKGVTKTPLRQDESLHERVERDLAGIKARPALVRSFVHADSVAYVLD